MTVKKRVGLRAKRLVARQALQGKARHRMRDRVLPDSHPPSTSTRIDRSRQG